MQLIKPIALSFNCSFVLSFNQGFIKLIVKNPNSLLPFCSKDSFHLGSQKKIMQYNIINTFCILFFTLFACSNGTDSETSKVTFVPRHYTLEIKTYEDHFKDGDTSQMKFDGVVNVEFDMQTSEGFDSDFHIILNTNPKTELVNVVLEGKTSQKYEPIKSCSYNLEKDKLIFQCPKSVTYRAFRLQVSFKNPFGNDMTGFYRSSYKDSLNNTRWILTTHFEPIYARNAFPCFDQPDLKAKFLIKITVPENITTVLSNTALKQNGVVNDANFNTYNFKETEIPMSTYLVAFTASDFDGTKPVEFKSDYLKDKFSKRELKTYGRKDIIARGEGDFAQKVGIEAINGLTAYLKLGYAFEKIDLVGIPDFSAGAMENWGHISFREKSLFVNDSTSSAITKQSNVLTITHELVHQWFGNLVTLKSWDYIWLNEAFANYLEYKIASTFTGIPSSNWNLMNQFVVNDLQLRAFEVDGLNSSKPMTNKITDENLIYSSFNDIPYAKGASVLRMWDYEFKDGFQKSLQSYLESRKENSADPGQLLEAFKKEVNMPAETFKTWTEQAGYPVVEVHKKNGSYYLTQSRFFWEKMTSTEIWHIPITYSTNSSKKFETSPLHWLYKEPLKIEEKCKWIIVNNQQAGYYRVNYDKENWDALSEALSEKNHSDIHELNRAQIVNDVFSLARSLQKKYVDYDTALTLTKYLKSENSLIPWKTALSAFDFLHTKIYKDEIYNEFKKYVLALVEPHFKGLNWTGSEHVEKLKNVEISRWACSLDFGPCVTQAKTLFSDSSYDKFPDTREIVLCTTVRNDQKVWDVIFNKYKNEEDNALKVMYISALGCTKNETQAKVFLTKTLEKDSGIRKQDLIYVLSSVYNGNSKNIEAAFEFIKNNYKKIATEYGGINPLGKALVGVAKKLTTKDQAKSLETLANEIKKSPEGKASEDSIENAIKIARSNVDWVEEKMSQLRNYFSSGSFVSYSFTLLLLCIISVFQF